MPESKHGRGLLRALRDAMSALHPLKRPVTRIRRLVTADLTFPDVRESRWRDAVKQSPIQETDK